MNLTDPVTTAKYVSNAYATKLSRLDIHSLKDLLTYFPREYIDSSQTVGISELINFPNLEELYVINAQVEAFKNQYIRKNLSIQTVLLTDDTGKIEAKFFNQPFLKNVFKPGDTYLVQGKVKVRGKRVELYPRNYDKVSDDYENVHLGRISPEYKLTAGVSKKWFRNRVKSLVDALNTSELKVENEVEGIYNIELNNNISEAHFPSSWEDLDKAIKELSIYELINVHLKILKDKENRVVGLPPQVSLTGAKLELFEKKLPFALTKDQKNIIKEMLSKLEKKEIVNTLVQGDVGSGKTIIAVFLAWVMSKNKYQSVVLAPTTVLAKQHFETFKKYLGEENVELVSSENKNSKAKKILVGTTAILARKNSMIKKLGLVIVDEQHRFGVNQRKELNEYFNNKGEVTPHLVNMTATPIPRTIAETFFSDLEVQTIKSKPKGRKPIKTYLVPQEKREDSYNWIKDRIISTNEQVYWVCPLIEESDKQSTKAAEKIYKELKNFMGNKLQVGLLHGKMKSKEKLDIMKNYSDNKIQILVSTTVIEVGVDVANATVMMIENAERFGLAQLHQIRGRVGRNQKDSFCFLFYDEEVNENSKKRLEFIAKNNDGLKIAEYDLETRGPGEVYGTKQSGIPNLKVARLNDIDLIKKSKKIAQIAYNKGIKQIKLFE